MKHHDAELQPQSTAKFPQIPFEVVIPSGVEAVDLNADSSTRMPQVKQRSSTSIPQETQVNSVDDYTDFEEVDQRRTGIQVDVILMQGIAVVSQGIFWIVSQSFIAVVIVVKGVVMIIVRRLQAWLVSLTQPVKTNDRMYQPRRRQKSTSVTKKKSGSKANINVSGNLTVNGDVIINNYK